MSGPVFLAASSHRATLATMAARALTGIARRPARIAVSYAAAGGPHTASMSATLSSLFGGARVTPFTVHGEARGARETDEAAARAVVEEADLVFLGGGDPVRGAKLLAAAGADAWIRAARARGAACMGLSAGAMMLCAWWAEWPDAPEENAPHDGGSLVPGTGVVPDLVVDCHAEEDAWCELKMVHAMLAERARARSTEGPGLPLRFMGIPSGSGIVVGPDGAIDHVGQAPYVISDRVGQG